MTKTLAAAAAALLALAGFALAAPAKDAFTLTANMKPRFEVLEPQGVPTGATGLLRGTAVELENDRVRVALRLTFSKLSGRALAAHIHVGRAGTAGGVMVALCAPCRNGQRGTTSVSHAQLRTIRAGRAYVNLHTARNEAGEIRGQVKASATVRGSGDDTSPSPTTPEPSPYP